MSEAVKEFAKKPFPIEPVSKELMDVADIGSEIIDSSMPLFEKIMAAVDRGDSSALEIALIMYYRASTTMESIEDFISLVTALEALFSAGSGKIAHKIALRAATITKDDIKDTKQVFEDVKKIYHMRSRLVHGDIIPR
ncbi:MAG: hypothetical protein ACREBU_20785, partial [Nitrososphaera sp.]